MNKILSEKIKKKVFAVMLILASLQLFGQCNCLNELKFLETTVENNLASYQDQVIVKKRTLLYTEHKEECESIAASLKDSTECAYLMAKYISFFRDEHFQMAYKDSYYPYTSQGDTLKIRSFYQKDKTYKLPNKMNMTSKGLFGSWESYDGRYSIEIIKDSTSLWDYAGIITKTDSLYWSIGQMKFGLKETGENIYDRS